MIKPSHMKDEFSKFLAFLVFFAYMAICIYFGVYFDIQSVATFLIATIFCPILACSVVHFIASSSFNYASVSQNFTRNITLQRIDPLLN